MEGRFPQGVLLKRVFDAVKELVTEVNLDCNESGITMQAMDTSHVALVMLSLKLGAFDHYTCAHDRSLGLNMVQVSKIFKLCGNDDQVIIRNPDDGEAAAGGSSSDKVTFIFDSASEDRVSDFQLRIQQLDQEHLGIPESHFAATVTMPSKQFAKIVNDLNSFSDSLGIVVTPKGIKFTAQGDFGSGNTLLKSRQSGSEANLSEAVEIACEQSSVALTFASRYLTYFAKASTLSDAVTLKLSPGQPLEVHFTLNNDPHVGYVKFYLAPKMDDAMA